MAVVEEVEDGQEGDLEVVMLEGREVVDICIEEPHQAETRAIRTGMWFRRVELKSSRSRC